MEEPEKGVHLRTGLGDGSEQDFEDMEDEANDGHVLDGIYLAGERFDRMVKRVLVS